MSRRQDARAERRYAFWMPRIANTTGQDRAEVAWQYLKARINDLPTAGRDAAWETVADQLVELAETTTGSEVHILHIATDVKGTRTLRAQARRAGARETA